MALAHTWPARFGALCALLLLAIGGCSNDASVADSGPEVDAAMPEVIAAEPLPPVLTPCAPGWREHSVYGVTACEPWPADSEPSCAIGEVRFAGSAACGPVGAPCPAGDWPTTDLPEDARVLFVKPGAMGGDGTEGAPFGAIAEASAVATTGTIIALSKGVAMEAVELPAGVTLIGACAAESRIEALTASDSLGVVTIRGEGTALRNVGIGGRRAGIMVDAGSVALDGVLVEGAQEFGIELRNGARATGQRVLIRGTLIGSSGESGAALGAFSGASVALTEVAIEDSYATGIWLTGSSTTATLSELSVVGTLARRDGRFGQGVDASGGATLTISNAVIARNVSGGAALTGIGTTLDLRDAIVRDIARNGEGRFGRGISLTDGAQAVLTRIHVARTEEAGLFANRDGTALSAIDVLVSDTRGAPGDAIDGFGIGLEEGASATIERAVFAGNQTAGVSASGGAPITLTDVVVRETEARSFDGAFGQGIHLEGEARIERVLIERNFQVGLAILGSAADAVISDLTVRRTRSQAVDGLFGRGVYISGGRATMTNVAIEDNQEVGIAIDGETTVAMDRLRVDGTSGEAASGMFGLGLVAQNGAVVTVTTGRFLGNSEIAISARGEGTRVELVDLEVLDTRERDCALTTCASAGAGIGLGVYTGAQLEARDFLVDGSALAGVQLAEGGTMDLHDGVISSNPIGANVQTADFDTARINDGVVYQDNQRNLDASGLPIAEPPTGL